MGSTRYSFTTVFQLSSNTCISFFVLSRSLLRNVIPDSEFVKSKSLYNENIMNEENCHESHFGLGKLFCHENNFDKACHQFNLAKKNKAKDYSYITWLCMAQAFSTTADKV